MDAGLTGGLLGVGLMVALPTLYYSCKWCYRKRQEKKKRPILPLYATAKPVPIVKARQSSMRSVFSLHH
jgi:hypothetical protein